jgi:zinc protease
MKFHPLSFGVFALCLLRPVGAAALEIAFETDNRLPIVYVNVAINSGAAEDPPEYSGLASFMGEMLLRGTQSKTKEQIDSTLDQMGAVIGVDTRSEMLVVRGAVLSSQLVPFLNLLLEIVTKPSFPEKEIQKLKSENVSELMSALSNDRYLAGLKFSKFFFGTHPYGNNVQGTIKGVQRITRERLLNHFNEFFVQERLIVAGTGDTNYETIKAFAETIARLRPQGTKFKRFGTPDNPASRQLVIVDKPDRTQVQIVAGHKGLRVSDPDYFAFYVGNNAFGGGNFQARMMQEIRVKRGWSYGAYSSLKFGRQPHSWQFNLFPAAKYADHALELALELVKTVKEGGITESEFNFSRDSIVNNSGFRYNTPQKRVENTLMEQVLELPKGWFKEFGNRVSKVTLDEVNASLKARLDPDHLVITAVATAKDQKENLAKAAGVRPESVRVVPYTEE